MKKVILFFLILLFPAIVHAMVQTQDIKYKDGDVTMDGFVAYDDQVQGTRPGVLVVHDWMGFGPFGNDKAKELAKLGYVAFAVDIFGENVRPKNTDEAGKLATMYKSDRALLRRRINAAYEALKGNPIVDPKKIAIIGFCFGGTTALELARSGTPLAGVVSFHGGLNTPKPEDAKNIKAKILVLHGADDPLVPPAEVAAFEKEMNDAQVDWQMVFYSGAVHSFTNPAAGNDNSKGVAYNANADKRSWIAMKQFFNEIF